MKKFLLLVLVLLSVFLGYSYAKDRLTKNQGERTVIPPKTTILKFALVADSEDDNGLLAKALNEAKSQNVSFVIGLGDLTSIGTVEQLNAAKQVFDESGLTYYLTAGDHDLWDSRNRGDEALSNFRQVLGDPSHIIYKEGIQFVILDNSDIYSGIRDVEISNFKYQISNAHRLTFVFAHKTPFHPQSAHVMGEDSSLVKDQAKRLMSLLEEKKVDGFFCGDLHFFAQFNSPAQAVRMTTIGAVASERNFQGPRFAVVTVYSDYSWQVEDIEIR